MVNMFLLRPLADKVGPRSCPAFDLGARPESRNYRSLQQLSQEAMGWGMIYLANDTLFTNDNEP